MQSHTAVIKRWETLARGLLVRARVVAQYGSGSGSGSVDKSVLGPGSADASDAASHRTDTALVAPASSSSAPRGGRAASSANAASSASSAASVSLPSGTRLLQSTAGTSSSPRLGTADALAARVKSSMALAAAQEQQRAQQAQERAVADADAHAASRSKAADDEE